MSRRSALLLLLAACASAPRGAAFPSLEAEVRERTGNALRWDRGGDSGAARRTAELVSRPLTAAAAVEAALLNHPALQALYEELAIGEAELLQAGRLENPRLELGLRLPAGGGGSILDLGVAQSLTDLLGRPRRVREASASLEAKTLRIAEAVIGHAAETAAAHADLVAAERIRDLRAEALSALEAGSDLAARLRAAGNASELDLDRERALLEEAQLDLRRAESEALVARARFGALLGLPRGWSVDASPEEPPAAAADPDAIEEAAVERSLALAALRAEARREAVRLGAARAEALFPGIEAGADAERESGGAWSVGPSLSIPIPLFDRGDARRAAAEAALWRLRRLHEASEAGVRAAARAAAAEAEEARERAIRLRSGLLPLRERIVRESLLHFNAMQIDAFRLLAAARDRIETEARLAGALRDFRRGRSALERILAGGSPAGRNGFEGGE